MGFAFLGVRSAQCPSVIAPYGNRRLGVRRCLLFLYESCVLMKARARPALRTFAVEVVAVLSHSWVMAGLAGQAHGSIGAADAALEVVAEFPVENASCIRAAGLAGWRRCH